MASKPIRLMIIDDSLFFREFMSRSLGIDYSVDVVGVIGSPLEALQKIPELNPNMITLDIEVKGIQFKDYIRKIRQEFPGIQIIIISPQSGSVFEALKAGAADFVSKPSAQMRMDNAGFIKDVLSKLKTVYSTSAAGGVRRSPEMRPVSPSPAAARRPATAQPPAQSAVPTQSPGQAAASAAARVSAMKLPGMGWNFPNAKNRVVAIGASTGGTEAILAVVRELPANTPGVVMVQHMPPVFTKMYAERLDKICAMQVKEAEHGDRVQQGRILLAPGGERQMRLAIDMRGYYVKLEPGEKVSGHCPSVDVLFESVAKTAGASAVGVILTGMGSDGAMNLLRMRESGAYTIGQDEATCVVYGMPMVAYNLGAVVDQLPLDAIPTAIIRQLSK